MFLAVTMLHSPKQDILFSLSVLKGLLFVIVASK